MHQQIVEAVRSLGNHDSHALGLVGVVKRIFQVQSFRVFFERACKLFACYRHVGNIQTDPHEIEVFAIVRILLAVQNIEPLLIEKSGNAGKKPFPVV